MRKPKHLVETLQQIYLFLESVFFKKKSVREGVWQDAAKFALGFALSAGAAYLLLLLTGNLLKEVAARSSEVAARLFVQQISYAACATGDCLPHLQGVANGVPFDAQIIELCSGKLELAVMTGLLVASRDKPLVERLKGIFLGALLLLIFNPLRIALTLASVGTPYTVLIHDALFRISLIVLLVVFYAFWYYWKQGAKGLEKNN